MLKFAYILLLPLGAAVLCAGDQPVAASDVVKAGERPVMVYSPSLRDRLLMAERAKGAALTQEEVAEECGAAMCRPLPASYAAKIEKSRGYHDIDPADAWRQWQAARIDLQKKEQANQRPDGTPVKSPPSNPGEVSGVPHP